MNVLIFNCGSSSQGFKVYQSAGEEAPHVLASGKAHSVATKTVGDALIDWQIGGVTGRRQTDLPSHRAAAQQILAILKENGVPVDTIGHRFVHGGSLFEGTARINEDTLEKLWRCLPLAPIHNPNSFSVIGVCSEELPGVPQVAVFDTAFHSDMPDAARQYAIPRDLAGQHGFRKVGFHGLSYQYVSAKMADLMGRPLESLKLILCHLGTGGSSVVAVKEGKSLDHSMGYSPLAGLVMSTRCGDIDPEIVLEMVRMGHSVEEVSEMLNNQSGLIGLSGVSSNLQEIIVEAEKGDPRCRLAYEVYAHRLKLYLGAYTWLLNGADAIVFTDDVGMKAWQLREKVCGGVENLGVTIDRQKNQDAPIDQAALLSRAESKTQVWAVPTDEEIVILREVLRMGG